MNRVKVSATIQIVDGSGNQINSGQQHQDGTSGEHTSLIIVVPDGTTDYEIPMSSVSATDQLFFWSDRGLLVKLFPVLDLDSMGFPFRLDGLAPCMLSSKNSGVRKITVSNDTGLDANLTMIFSQQ